MSIEQPDGYITRHSLKPSKDVPQSVEYQGITDAGVELAKERAKDIAEIIENAAPGTIIFQSPVSPEVRTRSTLRVYGDALKAAFADREDVIVVPRSELSASSKDVGFSGTLQRVVDRADGDPNAKVVIDLPLRLTEMMDKGWFQKDGKPTAYTNHLLEGGTSLFEAECKWFREEGKIDGEQVGPNPTGVAQNLLKALERLRTFAKKSFPDRPIIVGAVGHSFEIDALLAYLHGNGVVSEETYRGLQSGILNETEMVKIRLEDDGIVGEYRGMEMKADAIA